MAATPRTPTQGLNPMTAPFVQPAPQRRSLGTSGVFHVSDLSPSINPDILGPIRLRDKTRNLAAIALKRQAPLHPEQSVSCKNFADCVETRVDGILLGRV
jgi:hypothetical protein